MTSVRESLVSSLRSGAPYYIRASPRWCVMSMSFLKDRLCVLTLFCHDGVQVLALRADRGSAA